MTLHLLAFIVPLGLDTLAVSVALGIRNAPLLRVAITFAIFEALMPLIGFFAGGFVSAKFEAIATVFGGVILVATGLYIAHESREIDQEVEKLSFDSFRLALAAGLSISLDELAIGFPMHVMRLPILSTLAAIAAQAFLASAIGITFGHRLGQRFARYSGTVAGIAFIVLGAAVGFGPFRP